MSKIITNPKLPQKSWQVGSSPEPDWVTEDNRIERSSTNNYQVEVRGTPSQVYSATTGDWVVIDSKGFTQIWPNSYVISEFGSLLEE